MLRNIFLDIELTATGKNLSETLRLGAFVVINFLDIKTTITFFNAFNFNNQIYIHPKLNSDNEDSCTLSVHTSFFISPAD